MAKDRGYISLLSCNHDTPRPRRTLSPEELKLAYAVLFTLPGVPFLYYGDEIGMRYLDIPTKEGGYTRTGTRTPMQWKMGKNLGFSTSDEKDLYLPVDSAADAPTVEASEADPDALLHVVRRVFTLRQESTNFDADSPFSVLVQAKDKPFVYTRGNAVCAVNPSQKEMTLTIPEISGKAILYVIGKAECIEESLTIGGGSFVILE